MHSKHLYSYFNIYFV